MQVELGVETLKIFLAKTEVFLVNKDEAITVMISKQKNPWLNPKKLLQELNNYCAGQVIITDGARGAYAVADNKIYFQEVARVRAKDATGVGDAFGATFIWGLTYFHKDVQTALRAASINASAVIAKQGAQAGLLSQREMMREL